jgi:hypothetical protein
VWLCMCDCENWNALRIHRCDGHKARHVTASRFSPIPFEFRVHSFRGTAICIYILSITKGLCLADFA